MTDSLQKTAGCSVNGKLVFLNIFKTVQKRKVLKTKKSLVCKQTTSSVMCGLFIFAHNYQYFSVLNLLEPLTINALHLFLELPCKSSNEQRRRELQVLAVVKEIHKEFANLEDTKAA